jgi:acyl carrier protein
MTPERVIAKVFGVNEGEVGEATSNQNLQAWDSMGHMTLIMELESSFGVSLSMDEALTMTNVSAIKEVLERRGVVW